MGGREGPGTHLLREPKRGRDGATAGRGHGEEQSKATAEPRAAGEDGKLLGFQYAKAISDFLASWSPVLFFWSKRKAQGLKHRMKNCHILKKKKEKKKHLAWFLGHSNALKLGSRWGPHVLGAEGRVP